MILAYHQIVTEDCPYLYSMDARLFAEHMGLIRQMEVKPVLTFDDGYMSHYTLARPSLEKQSLTGRFFVTGAWVGQSGYMNWSELKELHNSGHQIGSHGWSHKMLTECSPADLREEVRRSKDILEQRLGIGIRAISCPGGAWNRVVATACAEAGYSRVYTSDAWTRCRRLSGIELAGRLMLRRTCTPGELTRILAAEHTPYAPMRLRYALTRAARKTLGIRLYHAIWCRAARWAPDDNLEGSRVATLKCESSN